MRFLRNYKLSIPVALGIAAILWLVFGYFAVHTAFIDDKVDEAAPTFSQPTTAPTIAGTQTTQPAALPTATSAPPPTAAPQPDVVVEATGAFVSLDHDTSGTVSVLGDGSGQRFLRIEDLNTSNGPDLNVYLVNGSDAGDFIDLGDLKGNIGDQNYEIPADANLAVYGKVVIWCVRFSSPFGEAQLQLLSA